MSQNFDILLSFLTVQCFTWMEKGKYELFDGMLIISLCDLVTEL